MFPLRWISPVLAAALVGCASAEGAPSAASPAPAPDSLAAPDTVPDAPPPEPEVSLEERWAAPFAVQSTGQIALRGPRPEAVRVAADTAAAAPRDTVRLAEVAVDTASGSSPARAGGADTARAATRPARPAGGSAAAAAPARSGRRTHEVQPGETFYGVARKYSVAPAALREANPGVEPERLRSGTTLWIPAASTPASGAAPARPADAAKPPARSGARTHTVVRGDTLFGIARKYGVSAAAIRAANRLEDDVVKLGQTLVIPAGS